MLTGPTGTYFKQAFILSTAFQECGPFICDQQALSILKIFVHIFNTVIFPEIHYIHVFDLYGKVDSQLCISLTVNSAALSTELPHVRVQTAPLLRS